MEAGYSHEGTRFRHVSPELNKKLLDVTSHWTAKIHQLYMRMLDGTPSRRIKEVGDGTVSVMFVVDPMGHVDSTVVTDCAIGYPELCKRLPRYFDRKCYRSFEVAKNIYVSFTLQFVADAKDIPPLETIPSFGEYYKKFREAYPRDR